MNSLADLDYPLPPASGFGWRYDILETLLKDGGANDNYNPEHADAIFAELAEKVRRRRGLTAEQPTPAATFFMPEVPPPAKRRRKAR